MEYTKGSVCAPKGFKAGGVHCGIRNNKGKNDLAMIVSDEMCSVAAVYTTNKVKGAPIAVTKEHIADGKAKAIICNSGNANTCAPNGEEVAKKTCEIAAQELGFDTKDIVVASTGVIGEEMSIKPFERGIPELTQNLKYDGGEEAAKGIMTTDTIPKEIAVTFKVGGKLCTIGGIAKGSGMIHPNMATMLSFITSDVAISSECLQKILSEDIKDTYNQVSVDGDTSTNDMVVVLANGMAENKEIKEQGEDFKAFAVAFRTVTSHLSRKLAEDGEGAGKLIVCQVDKANSVEEARTISKSVVSSSLFKAAIFGEDANWGRVLCAIGYAQGEFSTENIDVKMSSEKGEILVCKGSRYFEHSEEKAAEILSAKEIDIEINMNIGSCSATAWGCDLTYDYVKINGDYRS